LAIDRYWSGTVDETLELAERALDASTAAGDTQGRLVALYAVAFGCWTPARAERLLAVCEQYHDEAVTAGDRNHELLALRWLTHASTELGMVARGRACAEAAVELADDLGLTVQQWITRTIAASQLLVEGDLDRAEQLATDALTVGSVCEPVTSFDYVSLFTWTLAWLRGNLADIVGFVEEVATTPGVDTARRLGLALTYGELGRLEEARAILDEIDESVADAIPHDAQWYIAFAAMAEASSRCGHVEAARIAHVRLAPYEDRIAVNSVTATGPVAHHIGIAAWTSGDRDTALRLLRHSVDLADRVGAPVFAARSRLALAERLALDVTHRGDGSEINALAAAAISTAERHGLAGIRHDASRLIDIDLFPIAGGV
jgi:tetratricopeptide (TPR) repeat protein